MCEPKVLVIMGSKSDLAVMESSTKTLSEFGIPYKIAIASAHRTPDKVRELAISARGQGIKVIIAGAGYAAHLAGVIASHTTLPVIGVPIDASTLQGLDSLLATAQMPSGVPVAAMCIGRIGAKNAAIFAAQILACNDLPLAQRLVEFRDGLAREIEKENGGHL